ncbi:hypothetical protein J1N35_017689 [Gossypium stocksii]|uniref:DSP-PTPase phosphatase fused to NAD+ Kinase domain-containing protein n=1 Tax=Gossypium stocksii TaxID=47602 RepID=A0A9D3VNJ9_9ROSI|nr:hypothetical protein J1N35_017689 [Gossypium stocksii]
MCSDELYILFPVAIGTYQKDFMMLTAMLDNIRNNMHLVSKKYTNVRQLCRGFPRKDDHPCHTLFANWQSVCLSTSKEEIESKDCQKAFWMGGQVTEEDANGSGDHRASSSTEEKLKLQETNELLQETSNVIHSSNGAHKKEAASDDKEDHKICGTDIDLVSSQVMTSGEAVNVGGAVINIYETADPLNAHIQQI